MNVHIYSLEGAVSPQTRHKCAKKRVKRMFSDLNVHFSYIASANIIHGQTFT